MTSMAYIRREGSTVSHPLPVFVSSKENLLADAASRFQTLPDWSLPRVLSPNYSKMDSSGHRPLCAPSIGAHSSLLRLGRRSGCGGSGRSRAAMYVLTGVRVSSPSSTTRHPEDCGFNRRLPPSEALLARPEMVSGSPGPSRFGRSSPSGLAGGARPQDRPSASDISLFSFGRF